VFFFQAEDGIRDFHVTGVQTCALPISDSPRWPSVLTTLLSGDDLSVAEATWAMEQVISGEASSAQIAGFLVALRAKGESVNEIRSEEHTSELQSREKLVCRLLLEKKKA